MYKGKREVEQADIEIQIHNIMVNRENHKLVRDNQVLNITGTEYQIFMYLLENRGKACSCLLYTSRCV